MTAKVEFAYQYVSDLKCALHYLDLAYDPDCLTEEIEDLVWRVREVARPRLRRLTEVQEADLWRHVFTAIRACLSDEEYAALMQLLASDGKAQEAELGRRTAEVEAWVQAHASPIQGEKR